MLGKAMSEKEALISELQKELKTEKKRRQEISEHFKTQAVQYAVQKTKLQIE